MYFDSNWARNNSSTELQCCWSIHQHMADNGLTNMPTPPPWDLTLQVKMSGWYPGSLTKSLLGIFQISWRHIISGDQSARTREILPTYLMLCIFFSEKSRTMIRDLICKDTGFKNRLGTIGNKMIDTGGWILGNTSGFKNKLNKDLLDL